MDDFEAEWLYSKPFDFIHSRELEGCIGDEDALFRRAFKHLKPGGYIEFQAAYPRWLSDDGTAEKAENAQSWLKTLIDGSAKFGKSLEGAIGWKEKLVKAGFVDVKQEIFKVSCTLTSCLGVADVADTYWSVAQGSKAQGDWKISDRPTDPSR